MRLMGTGYTVGEVAWLLTMTHDQAISYDAQPRDSCAGLSNDHEAVRRLSPDESLPVIARWLDVQRARKQVHRNRQGLALIQLRAGGYTEDELAELLGRNQSTINRRVHASVDEILAILGREEPVFGAFHRDLCSICGERPRVRLAATRRRVHGGWKIIQAERLASVCCECLTVDLHSRMLPDVVVHKARP